MALIINYSLNNILYAVTASVLSQVKYILHGDNVFPGGTVAHDERSAIPVAFAITGK
jgi:hypothetical protein